MPQTTTVFLCECCALVVANEDRSGCEYYCDTDHCGRTMTRLTGHTVLYDTDPDDAYAVFTCDGCGDDMLGAPRWTATTTY